MADATHRRTQGHFNGQARGSLTAFVLLVCGLLSLDGPDNIDAFAWAVVSVTLALPWLASLQAELLRLYRLTIEQRAA